MGTDQRREEDIYMVYDYLLKVQEEYEPTIDQVRLLPDNLFKDMLELALQSDYYKMHGVETEEKISDILVKKLDGRVFLKNIDSCELDVLKLKVKVIESLMRGNYPYVGWEGLRSLSSAKNKIVIEIKNRFHI